MIVDISIDQGGCVETIQPTNYDAPTFIKHDVVHMGVTNLPGAVPKTASQALSGSVLHYAEDLAHGKLDANPALSKGVNVRNGQIVHPALKSLV